MSFDNSLIRAVHSFRHAYIHLQSSSPITRHQLIFLSMLIENGHVKDFTVRSVLVNGLSWELANQYLKALRKIGYATKNGRLWSITEAGSRYYNDFRKELADIHSSPLRWR